MPLAHILTVFLFIGLTGQRVYMAMHIFTDIYHFQIITVGWSVGLR